MSEVKKEEQVENVWAPPVFPASGRLPSDSRDVSDNYDRQCLEENLFRRRRNAKGQTQNLGCCHSFNLSLPFKFAVVTDYREKTLPQIGDFSL
ncbi:hypothetical protein FEA48_17875 [Pseudomonas nitroreducens]|uniref:Uncharacterized protein n=1 Tax=Pseudomonas nitroreducens TaxID=46680 RepID=A0A5R9A1T1_PSENT|nr:hypothetical protein [Pseudomonas nitroreducens]TLP72164.1 hypothetical protein FEA48_17875 [Pseudomonas nitroreducens]